MIKSHLVMFVLLVNRWYSNPAMTVPLLNPVMVKCIFPNALIRLLSNRVAALTMAFMLGEALDAPPIADAPENVYSSVELPALLGPLPWFPHVCWGLPSLKLIFIVCTGSAGFNCVNAFVWAVLFIKSALRCRLTFCEESSRMEAASGAAFCCAGACC